MRRKRFLSLWSRAVVLAVATLCVGVALVGAQPRQYRVAVLTPGLSYTPVLEGLQEGLAQLGYVAGKNVTFLERIRMERFLTSPNARRSSRQPVPMCSSL